MHYFQINYYEFFAHIIIQKILLFMPKYHGYRIPKKIHPSPLTSYHSHDNTPPPDLQQNWAPTYTKHEITTTLAFLSNIMCSS